MPPGPGLQQPRRDENPAGRRLARLDGRPRPPDPARGQRGPGQPYCRDKQRSKSTPWTICGRSNRAPSIPDLIIAATAELARLTVLHVNKDFDIIAEVTGQPVERLIT